MQQHCSKYFAHRHTLDPGVGSKGKKKSESRYVSLWKWSVEHHESKYSIISEMLHIKLKGKNCRPTCKQKL